MEKHAFRLTSLFSALVSIFSLGSHASAQHYSANHILESSGKRISTSKSDLAETAKKGVCSDGRKLTFNALDLAKDTKHVNYYFLRTIFQTNKFQADEAKAFVDRMTFEDISAINAAYMPEAFWTKINKTTEWWTRDQGKSIVPEVITPIYVLKNRQGKKVAILNSKIQPGNYIGTRGIIQLNRRVEQGKVTGDQYAYGEWRLGHRESRWNGSTYRMFCPQNNKTYIGIRRMKLIALCAKGETCPGMGKKHEPQRILLWIVDTFHTASPGRVKQKFVAPTF